MPYYARADYDDNGGIAIVESDTGTVWTSPGHPTVYDALEVARRQAAEWNGRDLEIITRLLGISPQVEKLDETLTDTSSSLELIDEANSFSDPAL